MKASTLRTFPHLNAQSSNWRTYWVFWGPYTGRWGYQIVAGKAMQRGKHRIGSWRAEHNYTGVFETTNSFTGKKTLKPTISCHIGKQASGFCSLLSTFMEWDAIPSNIPEEKHERFQRARMQYRMANVFQQVPDWALKLYRSKAYTYDWDTIALNPDEDFWNYLQELDGDFDVWVAQVQRLKMKGCTRQNFMKKLWCRGISQRAIDEAMQKNEVANLFSYMHGLTANEWHKVRAALGSTCTVRELDRKTVASALGTIKGIERNYTGGITPEDYNYWKSQGNRYSTDWGKECTNYRFIDGYTKQVAEVFVPTPARQAEVYTSMVVQKMVRQDFFRKMFPDECPEDLQEWIVDLWAFKCKKSWRSRISIDDRDCDTKDSALVKQGVELLRSMGVELEIYDGRTEWWGQAKHLYIQDFSAIHSSTWRQALGLLK